MSPVVRLGLAGRSSTEAVFVRAVVPMGGSVHAIDSFGAAVLFGLDLGLRR